MSDTKRPRDDSAEAPTATPSKILKVEEEESKVDVKSAMDAAGKASPLADELGCTGGDGGAGRDSGWGRGEGRRRDGLDEGRRRLREQRRWLEKARMPCRRFVLLGSTRLDGGPSRQKDYEEHEGSC